MRRPEKGVGACGAGLLAATLGIACTGAIDTSGELATGAPEAMAPRPNGSTTPRPVPESPSSPNGATCKASPPLSPMRRLTRRQYENSVRDLLGFAPAATAGLVSDTKLGPFSMNASGAVDPRAVDAYQESAAELATRALASLDKLLPCKLDGDPDGCARTFIERFGQRAFRRPLVAAEKDGLFRAFVVGKETGSPTNGVRLIVEAVLQSPSFLYLIDRPRAGAQGDVVPVDDHALAARLSYLLWGSLPDEALLNAAAAQQLRQEAVFDQQVRRMLADPRARDAIGTFAQEWLGIDHLPDAERNVPEFSAVVKDASIEEASRFVSEAFLGNDRKLETLFTGPFTFVARDAAVASAYRKFYGMTEPASAEGRVMLPPTTERAGVLSLPAVVAAHAHNNRTSVVLRGKFIRENLLCEHLPPPPPNAEASVPVPKPGENEQNVLRFMMAQDGCKACHRLMDPLGFALERFDHVGRYRKALKNGEPVDTRGEVTGTARNDGAVEGAIALGARLGRSAEVSQCLSTQWMSFATGRAFELSSCEVQGVLAQLEKSGGDLREMIRAVVASESFRSTRRSN